MAGLSSAPLSINLSNYGTQTQNKSIEILNLKCIPLSKLELDLPWGTCTMWGLRICRALCACESKFPASKWLLVVTGTTSPGCTNQTSQTIPPLAQPRVWHSLHTPLDLIWHLLLAPWFRKVPVVLLHRQIRALAEKNNECWMCKLGITLS